MEWKQLPTWLKGGLIPLGIYIIIIIFSVLISLITGSGYALLIPLIIFGKFGNLYSPLFQTLGPYYAILIFYFYYVALIFLTGSLIGWIIQKIKSKKDSEKVDKIKTNYNFKARFIGGLIGGIFGIFLFWQSMLSMKTILPNFLLILLSFPFLVIGSIIGHSIIITGIIGIIFYSIVGVLIGWILGKIKSRKQKNSSPI